MTFLFCKYDYSLRQQTIFGFIEAKSAKEAAKDPRVNLEIVGSTANGKQHLLDSKKVDRDIQWYLEEVYPLKERPEELA